MKSIFSLLLFLTINAQASSSAVHLTYHWHLHQPLYWPAEMNGLGRVQTAAESYDIKKSGGGFYLDSNVPHPQNNLATGDIGSYDPVFSNNDRIQVYQWGAKNSLETLLRYPDAGASISYSGSLIDNVSSWAKDNRMGYQPNWNQGYTEARKWKTSGGNPRADLVGFTYHHSLAPLLPKSVLKKEIQLFKKKWAETWGGKSDLSDQSRGFFPPEVAFSETLIPTLVAEGYQWSIVANGHLARTCSNYLEIAPEHSTGTWNTNPPNRADMTGPAIPKNQWWSGSLDGRGAIVPAPFAYQPHKARYIDPETGVESKLTIVPMDEVMSYMNGYSPMSTDLIDQHVAPFNDPAHPSLVLFAHDGDNAWGGGNSYYQESVPGLASLAQNKGYSMTTIQQFLDDHPVSDSDVVHIEDGPWVNPEGDWGDPQFVKWLYPPARSPKDSKYNAKDPRTFIDIENGFSSAWRSWAVIIAGANICETAEASTSPDNTNVKKAWELYLAGLDSGFMYYGDSLDDEVKQSLALNEATRYTDRVLSKKNLDLTPPTVFKPQRWPYNPGGIGWGSTTHYQDIGLHGKPAHSSDFYVWTLAYDLSGIGDVTLKVRASLPGIRSPNDLDHQTYRGGPSVGEWISMPMNRREIDPHFTGDPSNPNLNYFIQPAAIADHYWAKVTGYNNVLLDYYIEATDRAGNRTRSEISHVWVGN